MVALPLLLNVGITLLAGLFLLGLLLRYRDDKITIDLNRMWGILWESLTAAAALTSSISAFYFAWTGSLYPGQTMTDLRWMLAMISVFMFTGASYFYISRVRS